MRRAVVIGALATLLMTACASKPLGARSEFATVYACELSNRQEAPSWPSIDWSKGLDEHVGKPVCIQGLAKNFNRSKVSTPDWSAIIRDDQNAKWVTVRNIDRWPAELCDQALIAYGTLDVEINRAVRERAAQGVHDPVYFIKIIGWRRAP